MSLPGITIGPGISVGGGIGIGSASAFTISLADIANPNIFGGLGVYLGSGSWDINVPFTGSYPGSIADAIQFGSASAGVLAQWEANWTNAGYDYNSLNSYAWNAIWATGGTTVVRMRLNPNGGTQEVLIVPIDTTFSGWQSTLSYQVPAVQGVFTLPVTLTPYVPTTVLVGDWC
jgi:hypothetical protein